MTTPQFDDLVHQPHRLRICVILSVAEEASFQTLCDELGVAMPTLSKQLKMLTDAEYVKTRKQNSGTRPTTWATLTTKGREALTGHLAALHELAARAR